jgi:hypothetical protein
MSRRSVRFPATKRERLALSIPVCSAICNKGKLLSEIAFRNTSDMVFIVPHRVNCHTQTAQSQVDSNPFYHLKRSNFLRWMRVPFSQSHLHGSELAHRRFPAFHRCLRTYGCLKPLGDYLFELICLQMVMVASFSMSAISR